MDASETRPCGRVVDASISDASGTRPPSYATGARFFGRIRNATVTRPHSYASSGRVRNATETRPKRVHWTRPPWTRPVDASTGRDRGRGARALAAELRNLEHWITVAKLASAVRNASTDASTVDATETRPKRDRNATETRRGVDATETRRWTRPLWTRPKRDRGTRPVDATGDATGDACRVDASRVDASTLDACKVDAFLRA